MLTFNARFIANIIQFAGQQGADRRQLIELTGKENLEALNDPALRFESGVYNRVLEKALKLTGDPFFGLHAGEFLNLSAAGLIVQIIQSSRTVLEALEHLVTFANLGCSALPYQLRELETEWELSMIPAPLWEDQSPDAVRHTLDGAVMFTLRAFHTLTRQKHRPARVHFTYLRPEKFMEYERLFHCPVYFSKPLNAIFLDKKHVTESVITGDYDMLRVLVRYAEEKLSVLKRESGYAAIVRQSILHLVKPQFPNIGQVAANLNISIRSLQRRLAEEGLSFQSVTDSLKRQLAMDYLANQDLNIKEIAYLLDYADASAFIRSFKRWESVSPLEWRNQKV